MQIVSLKIRILWVVGLFFAALTTAVYATPKPAMGIALEDSKGITRQYRCMEVESHSGALADASSDNAAVESMTNSPTANSQASKALGSAKRLPGDIIVENKNGGDDVIDSRSNDASANLFKETLGNFR